ISPDCAAPRSRLNCHGPQPDGYRAAGLRESKPADYTEGSVVDPSRADQSRDREEAVGVQMGMGFFDL
ncbi:MAG: hypothetical protein ACE5EC_09210, partial [Phycisphaerae bacterium]